MDALLIPENERGYIKGHTDVGDGGHGDFLWDKLSTETDNNGSIIELDAGGVGRWKRQSSGRENAICFGLSEANVDQASILTEFLSQPGDKLIPAGRYKVNSPVFIGSDVDLKLAKGAVLDFAGGHLYGTMLNAKGTEGVGVELTSNAAKDTSSVSVAVGAESQFSPGDHAKVYSDDEYDSQNVGVKLGEIVQVLSVASGVILFRAPLQGGTYTTSKVAKIAKLTLAENIRIRGGKIIGNVAVVGNSNAQIGIAFDKCRNVTVKDLDVQSFNGNGVVAQDTLDFTMSRGSVNGSSRANSGYGVVADNATNNALIYRVSFSSCRHAFTTANSSPCYGIVRNVTVERCVVENTLHFGDALDTHAAAEDIDFVKNIILSSSGNGINFECTSGSVVGNKINNTAFSGISAHSESDSEAVIDLIGNVIRNAGGEGIRLSQGFRGTPFVSYKSANIDRNKIYDCDGLGIYVRYVSIPLKNVGLSGNLVVNAKGNNAILVANVDGLTVFNTVVIGAIECCVRIDDCNDVSIVLGHFHLGTDSGVGVYLNAASLKTKFTVSRVTVYADAGKGTTQGLIVAPNCDWVSAHGNNFEGTNTPINPPSSAGNNYYADNVY